MMCKEYCQNKENQILLKKLISYYKSLKKTHWINIHFVSFSKYLGGKNLTKKMLKELVLFHFPVIGFIIFCLG